MKRKFFLLLIIFLITSNTNWAQVTDPDWFFLKKDDSLVFHLLDGVNTNTNDEYFPILVNQILYFNSDRRNLLGDESSLAYNENAYTAKQVNGIWTNTEKSYFWNSDDHTVTVGFNESNLFIYKTFGNGDIYISSKKENWTVPKKLPVPINTEGHEQSIACVNGLLVVSSERKNSCAHDIFWVKADLGNEIKELNSFPFNTSSDEIDVSLSPDGRTMYFSSDQNGNYDIYSSNFSDGIWSKPIALPAPVNSPKNDGGFRNCDSVFYMHSDRSGSYDLFEGYTFPRKTSVPNIILSLNEMLLFMGREDNFTYHKQKTDTTKSKSELSTKNNSKSSDTVNIEIKLDRFDRLENYIDSAGISEYYARVQIGAYYQYSVQEFKKVHPSLKNTEIIIESVKTEKGSTIQKFLISQKFYTLEEASRIQAEMVEKHGIKDAFVAVYSVDNQRIAIFNVYTGNFVLLSGDKRPVKF